MSRAISTAPLGAESFYAGLGVDLPGTGAEAAVRCFADPDAHRHGDKAPSCSVNRESGVFRCHGCGAAGGPYDAALRLGRSPAEAMRLLEEHRLKESERDGPVAPRRRRRGATEPAAEALPSEDELGAMHSRLLENDAPLERLRHERGWTRPTVEALGLGWDGQRLVVPVRGAGGELLSVLRYLPGARNDERKLLAPKGRPRELYPAPESLSAEELWLVEGEPDAIAGLELGFATVGVPGAAAAGCFDPARFDGRRVVVCFDCDEAGRKAGQVAAERLLGHAADVRVVDMEADRSDGYDLGDLLVEASVNGGPEHAGRLLLSIAADTEPLGEEPMPACELLDSLSAFLRRFVVMSEHQTAVVALWLVHTHAISAADVTPFLAVTSAERRSGKSLLLDVLELVAARPWRVISPSEAVMFRKIERDCPTLLLDETDAIFKGATERTEPLRALLNAGNRRGTTVPRCVGQNQELRDFSTFCARALAGIGELPPTVADRSLPIRLERRAPGEHVQRYRRRHAEPEAESLRQALDRFGQEHLETLREAEPELPAELDDRAQDAAEPLLAIADLAGGDWPNRAREALIAVRGAGEPEDDSAGIRLLSDIRAVLAGRDRASTQELLEGLHRLEESPWGEWYGKPLTSRVLAKLLRPYNVRSKSVRLEDGSTPKGFQREQFESAWKRYLPGGVASSRHNATTRSQSGIEPDFAPQQEGLVADAEAGANPHEQWDVAGVAAQTPGRGVGAR